MTLHLVQYLAVFLAETMTGLLQRVLTHPARGLVDETNAAPLFIFAPSRSLSPPTFCLPFFYSPPDRHHLGWSWTEMGNTSTRPLSSHSLKSTMLSFASKRDISHQDRLSLGHHSHPFKMADVYARDAQARDLRLMDKLIAEIRSGYFCPEESRAVETFESWCNCAIWNRISFDSGWARWWTKMGVGGGWIWSINCPWQAGRSGRWSCHNLQLFIKRKPGGKRSGRASVCTSHSADWVHFYQAFEI